MDKDIVVVGGGGSGLAAAVSAAEAGARVLVIEKNAECGGTTACSIGSISATGTVYQKRLKIVDNKDDHYEDMALFPARDGEDRADKVRPDNDVLRRILVDEVPQTFQWLYDMGIEFFGPNEEAPHRVPRMHNVMPTSRSYIYHLEKRARALGVQIVTSAQAKRFLQDESGAVRGVEYEQGGKLCTAIAGKAVILASGDYAGDPEFRRNWVSEDVARFQPVNPTNTGDGHRMAFALGAQIINKDMWSGGLRFVRPPKGPWMTRLPPYRWLMKMGNLSLRLAPGPIVRQIMMSFLTTVLVPSPKLYKNGAIIVNRDGKRFHNELKGIPYNLAYQPKAEAFIVFDGELAKKFSGWPYYISTAPGIAYAYLADYKRTRKDIFYEAPTIEALAAKLGVPAMNLRLTIDAHNRSNEVAGPEGLEPRGDRPKLEEGPWYALGPTRNFIHYTDGGLAIDAHFRLLGREDQPIEGLYAVGNVGQGGALLRGHGHHLAWAFTSGRLVGKIAAGRAAAPVARALKRSA